MRLSLLTFTLRVLWKNRLFTLLNVFGLTFGLAASIWLALYLKNELTYDQHHEQHERIYRLSHKFSAPGVEFNTAASASELPPMLQEEFPEVLKYARFVGAQLREISYDNTVFAERDIFYTDQEIFEIFTHEFLAGNPEQALTESRSAVITASINQKLFGDEPGLNEIVKIDGFDFKITGVIADPPKNTHFTYQVLLSGVRDRGFAFQDGEFNSEVLWNSDAYCYILVPDGFNKADFLKKFEGFNERYYMPFGKVVNGSHYFRMQQLADIHYDTEKIDDDLPKGNEANLLAFTAIGLAILLLACINYVNLATARAGLRSKEIGIRKVLGSSVRSLKAAILMESLVQVFASLFLAAGLVWLVVEKTAFQSWLGANFEFNLLSQPDLLLGLLLLVLVTGFISGTYPAFYLSKINTVSAIKGSWKASKGGHWLRQGLVLFQFVISIGVLSATLLMRDQISFLQKSDLGFAKDQLIVLNTLDSTSQARSKALKDQLLTSPYIESVSSSNFVPGLNIGQVVFTVDTEGEMKQQEFKFIHCGRDYLETMQIPLKEGRFFTGEETRGNAYFVVNETAAKLLSWEEPVGKKMGFFHQETPGQVIGVVRDFNFFSLHNPIEPLVFVFNPSPGNKVIARYAANAETEAMEHIKSTWNDVLPNYPLDYSFLNQNLRDQYEADQNQNQLVTAMTILCIVISLIGLSGLSAFNVSQRSKEIGVRKVLGAMSGQIVRLVFSSTLKLVLIAAAIAAPLTYMAISRWSSNFAYQAGFSFLSVFVAIMASLILTFVIVGGHVWKTARKNPSDTLRYE
jgi:putative ABC transport system permease protein